MTVSAEPAPTVRPKEFHFPLTVEWIGGRRVAARVEGKPAIEITPPPVFRGTDPATWSRLEGAEALHEDRAAAEVAVSSVVRRNEGQQSLR
jgi:hypothetical protein